MNVVLASFLLALVWPSDGLLWRQDAQRDAHPRLASLIASLNQTARLKLGSGARSSAPYLRSLEATLLAMAQNTSQIPSQLLHGVKSDVMTMVSNELKPRIITEHSQIQSQIAEFSGLFAKCEEVRGVGLNESYSEQQAIPVLIANHKACRKQESALQDRLSACRTALQSSRLVDASTCESARLLDRIPEASVCSALNGESAEAYHQRMLDVFRDRLKNIRIRRLLCQNTTGALHLQESACDTQAREVEEQRTSCNLMQRQLDASACDLSMSMNTTCSKYQACRSQATLSYDLVRNTVKARESNLHDEWKALKHIECILEAMVGSNIMSAAQECGRAIYSVAHLMVVYITMPPCQACEDLAEVPGTADYNATVFADIPANAPVTECAASCCFT
ncbi:unnamed protein product [Symbiodinium natans]|uniref:Uncharacterized protein n=1 Tax=Symbiodinium natans TaxID=878477 RepID=A0A812KF49_9DINO|nr:unnamed protein product [Symbiodinium natans]